MSDIAPEFPPFVYAPVSPAGGAGGASRLSMNELDDGRTAVLVYSALDRMREMYGEHPWVVATLDTLSQAHAEIPYDVLLLDTVLERSEPATEPTSAARRPDTQPPGLFVAGSSPVTTKTVQEDGR